MEQPQQSLAGAHAAQSSCTSVPWMQVVSWRRFMGVLLWVARATCCCSSEEERERGELRVVGGYGGVELKFEGVGAHI